MENKEVVEIDFLINFINKKLENVNFKIEKDKSLWGYHIGEKEAYSVVIHFLERIKRDINKGGIT